MVVVYYPGNQTKGSYRLKLNCTLNEIFKYWPLQHFFDTPTIFTVEPFYRPLYGNLNFSPLQHFCDYPGEIFQKPRKIRFPTSYVILRTLIPFASRQTPYGTTKTRRQDYETPYDILDNSLLFNITGSNFFTLINNIFNIILNLVK